MKIFIYIFLFLILSTNSAQARSIIADVNPRKINIDQSFKGLDLLVYGARNDAGNIVVVVRGPKENQILRKKGKVFGIWTNVKNMEIDNLYSMYGISTMRPLTSIQNDVMLKNLEVGLENVGVTKDGKTQDSNSKIYESVINLMTAKNLYYSNDEEIVFWGETLFKTFVNFPKNVSSGVYNIDVYLFNDGLLSSFQTMPVIVEKVGLEAFVHNYALKQPLLYGLICVFIALSLGLAVGLVFSRR